MVRFGDFLETQADTYSGVIEEDNYLDYEKLKDLIYNDQSAFLHQFVSELEKLREFLEQARRDDEDHAHRHAAGCPCKIPERNARMQFMKMNREGCRKILKKYDKRTRSTAGPEYMEKVDVLFQEYLSVEDAEEVKRPLPPKHPSPTRQPSPALKAAAAAAPETAAAPEPAPLVMPVAAAAPQPARTANDVYAPMGLLLQNPAAINKPLPLPLNETSDAVGSMAHYDPLVLQTNASQMAMQQLSGLQLGAFGNFGQQMYPFPALSAATLLGMPFQNALAAAPAAGGFTTMQAEPAIQPLDAANAWKPEPVATPTPTPTGSASSTAPSTPAAPVQHVRWLECCGLKIGLLNRFVETQTVKNTTKVLADRQVVHSTPDLLVHDPQNKGRYLIPPILLDDTNGKKTYGTKKQSFVCMLYQKGADPGHRGCNAHHSCNQLHVSRDAIAHLRKVAAEETGYTVTVEGNFVVELRGVLDPSNGKSYVFPFHRTEHTAGRVAYARTVAQHRKQPADHPPEPAPVFKICLAYLDGHCRHGKGCRDIHVEPPFVAQLRCGNPCCPRHDPHRCSGPTDGVPIRIALPSSVGKEVYDVPPDLIAMTKGLAILPVKHGKGGAFKCFASGKLCRLHKENRCEFGARCNNIHLCHEFKPGQAKSLHTPAQNFPMHHHQPPPAAAAAAAPQHRQRGNGGKREVTHNPYLMHPPIRVPEGPQM